MTSVFDSDFSIELRVAEKTTREIAAEVNGMLPWLRALDFKMVASAAPGELIEVFITLDRARAAMLDLDQSLREQKGDA